MSLSYDEWMEFGLINGWCGPPVCYTHDGLPLSVDEDEEFSEGDPCIHIIRMYENTDIKQAVEKNHAPSIWRNHYTANKTDA